MFQSYTIKYHHYDIDDKKVRFGFTIVDDDWIAVGVESVVGDRFERPIFGVEATNVVIEEYSKRNLPVAPNLFRCICFIAKKYGYSIQQVIDCNMQYNKQYLQYEEEINKLLLLL